MGYIENQLDEYLDREWQHQTRTEIQQYEWEQKLYGKLEDAFEDLSDFDVQEAVEWAEDVFCMTRQEASNMIADATQAAKAWLADDLELPCIKSGWLVWIAACAIDEDFTYSLEKYMEMH